MSAINNTSTFALYHLIEYYSIYHLYNIKYVNDCSSLQGVLRTAESLGKLNEIEKFNGIATKTSQIEKMSLAVKGLTKENALLLLANKNVNIEDQKKILTNAKIITEEEAKTMAVFASTTATTTDTAATTANTAAKGTNLSITNLLRIAWQKLIATMKAHPFIAITAASLALGKAINKVADRFYNTEKYAKKALDKSAEKVDNVKSEIDSLNSELQTTQSRINELNAKENLSLVEREELEKLKETNKELEREIRLKQSILSEDQKEANKDAKKYFTAEKDSLNYESSYEGVEIREKTDYIGTVEERIDRLQQHADGQIKLSEETIKSYKDYVESVISDFMDSDDYLVEGLDDGLLDRLNVLYEKYDICTNGKASVTENKLRGILAKADFQSTAKQLEELGKSGELSITTLSSQFPELIEYLNKAAISAEELYQYIMALSNPDAINYAEIEKRFMRSLGFGEGVDNAGEAQIWNEVRTLGDEEIILDAYLRVCDQYGEHPEGWNAKDWITHIQSELKTEELAVNVSFEDAWADSFISENDAVKELGNNLLDLAEKGRLTVDTFNQADSTGYFKVFNISADEAVEKINTLVDESKQLSSMSSQISSISGALGTKKSNGFVDADTLSGFDSEVRSLESWDRFQEMLGSTTTSYQECEKAANALATEWVNSSDFLAQLTEQNKEYYETQLEAMGVENYEEVIESTLALKEAKEALADVDMSKATAEDIETLIQDGKYSSFAAEQIWSLYYAKLAESGTFLDSSADCAQLQALADDAMLTAQAVELLDRLMKIYNGLESGAYNGNRLLRTEALEEASKIKSELESLAKGEGEGLITKQLKLNGGSSKRSGSGSSVGSKDTYKEKYDQELKELERMHDMGLISDEEYWRSRIDLNEKYFGESSGMHQKYLDEYQKNEEDILKGLKDLWKDYYSERRDNLKDLISYAEKLYDKEINSLEAAIEKLKEKRDAEEEIWKSQIDALDDEIDALQKANEERERAIDLQNKQWALQKAMHQRTTLLYSESGGMRYVADDKAVRDAKNDLDSTENDNRIKDLKKQQEDLQNQLDIILETYDRQIESIEKQIDSLKQVKSAWSEIVDNQELRELEERLRSVFGDDVKDRILSGNTDFINSIIAQYSSTSDMLRTIEDATLADIQNMVAQYGVLPENLMPIADAAVEMTNALGTVDTSGFNTNLESTAQSSSNAAEKVQSVTNALNTLSNDISGYQIPALNTDDLAASLAEDGTVLTAMREFVERFRAICAEIPSIWENSLSEAFSAGGGNGDPLSGGLPNDTKYSGLFAPVITALDNCKLNMEAKLKECLGTFSTFQTDLSAIIGISGDSGNPGASQSGAESGASDTITGAVQEGGNLIDNALNGEEGWTASFDTAKDSILSHRIF